MTQTTTGLRALLGHAAIYTAFQSLLGAQSGWKRLVEVHLRLRDDDRVLDVGCGPADILEYLPAVEYTGYDISESYIARARERFSHRGTFHCRHLGLSDVAEHLPFDVVIGVGLLHHLDDTEASDFLRVARAALKPGGRLVTIDPCWAEGQNAMAKILIAADRGRNVRSAPHYERLAGTIFSDRVVTVEHRRWIPYTHCIMECTAG